MKMISGAGPGLARDGSFNNSVDVKHNLFSDQLSKSKSRRKIQAALNQQSRRQIVAEINQV